MSYWITITQLTCRTNDAISVLTMSCVTRASTTVIYVSLNSSAILMLEKKNSTIAYCCPCMIQYNIM